MTTPRDLIGQTLGQYRIVEQIGQGGMASVFKAYQPGLERHVALKVLPPYVASQPGFTERFLREAKAIGNLHHPNILPVYDSGQDKGYSYIAMRYIPQATTLTHLMKRPLDPPQIAHLAAQIAAALDHAHRAGIVHRDVKPSNILLDGDWALLSDFGLAKMVENPSELTGTGVGIGTPAYMSPEQARGEKVDRRTDIYALGIILFEMLTGQVPHQAETPLATILKRINEPLPSPRSLNPAISPAVEKALLTALATAPAGRFNSAGEFVAALQAAFTASSGQAAAPIGEATVVSPLSRTGKFDQPPPRTDRLDQPEAAVPGQEAPAQPGRRAISPQEIVILVLLAVVTLAGLFGILFSFIPTKTGQDLTMVPSCSGMALAGLSSAALVWLRNKNRPASAWLAVGIMLWFAGLNILGWGGFAALHPGDQSEATNLGYSVAFCFGPGGLMALAGLLLYGYDYRQGRKERPAQVQAGGTAAGEPGWTAKLKQAAEYRTHITKLIAQKRRSALADQLTPIPARLEQWEAHLRQLVDKLSSFEANRILQRDRHDVPAAIARLQRQLETETNAQMRAQLAETLAGYQAQQRQLDALAALMRRIELEIEETLAEIGTIYSQLQLLGAKEVDSSRAKRLSTDIDSQANRLNDLLAAMDEVYSDAQRD